MADEDSVGALLTYLLLLPCPVPVPHGSTWTHELELSAPGQGAVEWRATPGTQSRTANGLNFVSMKFWQPSDTVASSYGAVSHVADMITGTDRSSGDASPPKEETYQTVVEVVTWVEDASDDAEASQALTRCIEELLAFHRSYRLGAHALVPELTYERIHPVAMRLTRTLGHESATQVSGLTLLDHMNVPVPAPEPLGYDAQEVIARFSERLAAGDPFMLYAERRLEGLVEGLVNGRQGESVVQTAIAAEVLLDATLGLMLWEESLSGEMTDADAATVFSQDLLPRMKNQYHPRLGGEWSLERAHLSPWYEQVARVRGRVVHAGYRPTSDEAQLARDALITLEGFIGDRLAASFKNYPKTAWLFLGDSGFAKRGRTKAAKRWADDLDQTIVQAQPGWLRQYAAWRAVVNAGVERRQKSQ